MTEQDKTRLRAAIAVEVMGWQLDDGVGKHWYTIEPDGTRINRANPRWKPDEDIAAAWQVLLHMFAQGWWMNPFAYFHEDGWSLHLKHKEHAHVYIDGAESDCIAVCLAAYKAVKGRDFE